MTTVAWAWLFSAATCALGIKEFVRPGVGPLNYAITVLLCAAVVLTWLRHRTITGSLRFLWPAAALSVIGAGSFVHSRWIGDPMSYAAALVPMGILTAGCVLRPSLVELRSAIRIVTGTLVALACIGALWSLVVQVVSAGSMMVALLALLIVGFSGHRRLMAAMLVVNAAYLVLWPSSTALVAVAAMAAFWTLRALGHVALFRNGVQLAVAAILALNLAAMVRPEVLAPLMQTETTLSGGIGQHSNSEFRLGVIRAASHDYLQTSLWIGRGFTGTINATNVPAYLPWWHRYEAEIHSDIAIMIQQGGLVGFLLIAAWWIGILRLLVHGARRATAAGQLDVAAVLDATLLGVLVVAVYASFNAIVQQLGMMLPLYVLVWIGALARDQDRDAIVQPTCRVEVPTHVRPVLVETAVLLALTPMVLFSGAIVWLVPVVIVGLWAGLHRWTGRAWPASSLNRAIAALLMVVSVSLLFSGGRVAWAAPKVATLVLGIAWYFALVRQHRAGLEMVWLVRAQVAACVGLTAIGVVASYWLDKIAAISEVTSRLPQVSLGVGGLHPNPVAGVLVLLAPMCLPLMMRQGTGATPTTRLERIGAGLALIAALVLLVLTQSRGGWLSAATAGLVLLLYRVPVVKSVPAAPVVLAFAAGCAVVGLSTFVPAADLVGGDLDHKWLFRLETWRLGGLIIGDFPWTGVGFNGFRHLAPVLYPALTYPTEGLALVHPHNMWLSAGVDFGIPGLCVLGAIWITALRSPIRLATSGVPAEALVSQCVLAAWVGFLTFGIADAVPLGTKLGTALWLSLATAQGLNRRQTP